VTAGFQIQVKEITLCMSHNRRRGRSHCPNPRGNSLLFDVQGNSARRPSNRQVGTFRSGQLTGGRHCKFWPDSVYVKVSFLSLPFAFSDLTLPDASRLMPMGPRRRSGRSGFEASHRREPSEHYGSGLREFQAASNRPNSADSMKTSSQSPKARPYGSLAPWPKW
jgi:hypothetical protein